MGVFNLINNNFEVKSEDIRALEKIIDQIKNFSDKNLISKKKINFERIRSMLKKMYPKIKSRDERFQKILRKLKSIIKREIYPQIFFIVGGHGGIIIDGIGFCEFDSPKFALDRLLDKMRLAIETGMPYNIEVAMCCLEWLNDNHPELIEEFKRVFNLGRFEVINSTYSQPYSLLIGPESNVKQFEYGMKVLEQLGLNCKIYWASESSLHPQIPQLLKGFNIKYGSLRTRLLGLSPSTPSSHIKWVGLDKTSIETITDQAGVFNGEYWHGTFFQEFPTLLFQAVARPFLNHIVYSSIDDFINLLPYQEEIWRVSRFARIFGEFIQCSEFFKLTEIDGDFQFNRDDFYLGDYIFLVGDLFLNNKKCENILISAEILNCILGKFDKESRDSFFQDLWKKLLLTQAHDSYAVPFIMPGDYSAQQLKEEEYKKMGLSAEKVAISELSIKIQKEIQASCSRFINESLDLLIKHLGNSSSKNQDTINFLAFNPTPIPRRDIVSIPVKLGDISELSLVGNGEPINFHYQDEVMKFIPEIPPLGYAIYSLKNQKANESVVAGNFLYDIKITKDSKRIEIEFDEKKVCELKFQSASDYQLQIDNHKKNFVEEKYLILGKIKNKTFKLEISQYSGVNRLEFILESNSLKEIVLVPTFKISKSFINYPFGIEETKRTKIQTLDFLWLLGDPEGIIFLTKNSQRFLIDRETFTIRNLITPSGVFEFAIAMTNEKKVGSMHNPLTSFKMKLLGVKINQNFNFSRKSGSFLEISAPVLLVNMWRRNNHSYLRVFNSSNCDQKLEFNSPLIKNDMKVLDFNYTEMRSIKNSKFEIGPWKILTLKIC